MRKLLLFCLLFSCFSVSGYSQDNDFASDSIVYQKDVMYAEKRTINSDLKQKYSGKDFIYTENIIKEETPEPINSKDLGFFESLISFITSIFPYLIGLIVVIIILKTFLNTETGFWNFKKQSLKIADTLIYEEDEGIEESDFDKLLRNAVSNNDFRLAIRYYYLILLKELSLKNHISYHKDKTNSEYLFELKDKKIQSDFSYLSYIYEYVWYGEFKVNQQKFDGIRNEYKSFINNIN